MTRLLQAVLLGFVLLAGGHVAADDDPEDKDAEDKDAIQNPYFEKTEWRVWRDNDEPIEVMSLVRKGKEKIPTPVTIQPVAKDKRTYPVDPPQKLGKDPYVAFKASATASKKYAGMWDDVYASWSGLHGYVRTRWRAPDGSNVTVRGQILDFVDVQKVMVPAGVNFIHQSTTSMGHAITNGGIAERTLGFEKLYFADILVCSPAHASWTDHRADYSTDLYTAHTSTLFNSVGSSNSETMAITKMAIVGAYLPPKTKLLLKRNGLYPAALLYIWKAALPYDEPYGHELRHRIAYKAVGDRVAYSKLEKYGAAGIDRGDMSLAYHCYDDAEHMRRMVEIARSMDVSLPEALFTVAGTENDAAGSYRLRKAAVVVQEKDKDVTVVVSTEGCYDLQGLPLTVRWKLLYGNKAVTVTRDAEKPHEWKIHVPWDAALPEGRTALALIANNGRFDSNPAILTIYRKKADDLPPSGLGPKDYRWPGTFANRRPLLLGLQDRWVKPGRKLDQDLLAIDPEGRPVTFYKRAGEVGTIDGSRFTWTCPRKAPEQAHTVTVIASDTTGGNSYGGEAFTIHVEKPAVLAQIDVDHLVGKAPMTVKVSGKPSLGKKLKYGWDFYEPSYKRKAKAFKDLTHGRETSHTFEKPGIYDIALAIEGADGTDSETIRVWVTKDAAPERAATLRVEGNGVLVRAGDDSPDPFDHTDFGAGSAGEETLRTFRLVNLGDAPLRLNPKKGIVVGGEHAADFRVVGKPRRTIEPRGSALFTVRCKAKKPGTRTATVTLRTGAKTYTFTVQATVN